MSFGRVCGLALGLATAAFAVPAVAQQASMCPSLRAHPTDGRSAGLARELLEAPCGGPSLPPAVLIPIKSDRDSAADSEMLPADMYVASTELGFARAVAPAPGRAVTHRGEEHLVVD